VIETLKADQKPQKMNDKQIQETMFPNRQAKTKFEKEKRPAGGLKAWSGRPKVRNENGESQDE
jgi:hypothetical protein